MTDSVIFIHTAPSLCELIDRLLTWRATGRLIVRLEFSSEKHQVHIKSYHNLFVKLFILKYVRFIKNVGGLKLFQYKLGHDICLIINYGF